MLKYLIYSLFIVSVALAAYGIILTSRLKKNYNSESFSSLLYFQVFIYTFGFYVIWGQVVLKAFLTPFIDPELIILFINISMLLGVPFIIFAWLMLVRFSVEISGRVFTNRNTLVFLLINFSIIFTVGYLFSKTVPLKHEAIIKYYFVLMNLIITLYAAVFIISPGKRKIMISNNARKTIFTALLIITALQCLSLSFYSGQPLTGSIFILTFFAGNAFLPFYLSYGTQLSFLRGESLKNLSFIDFCKNYEISQRESDIVREICKGLSNKEISETLFISLQTVKDHTHRIYIKVNVKSRAQLMNMVRELTTLKKHEDS